MDKNERSFYVHDSENEDGVGCSSSGDAGDEDKKASMTSSNSLQMILTSIAKARSRECSFISSEGFQVIEATSFWLELFETNFLNAKDDYNRDDLLFYIRKSPSRCKYNTYQSEVEVYRKNSASQPSPTDKAIDWEETVYLNLILQHLEYHVTCAVCTKTGDRDLQILRKVTQKVYASPSRRRMDTKGTCEQITYPNIFFTVDNFEEVFADVTIHDSELIIVELIAQDRHRSFQGVIFLSTIRFDALNKAFDNQVLKNSQKWSNWFRASSLERVQFVELCGPMGKGHAELAVGLTKTAQNKKEFSKETVADEVDPSFRSRRMSDSDLSSIIYSSRKSARNLSQALRKCSSAADGVNTIGRDPVSVEATDIEDALDPSQDRYNGFLGRSFGQAWHYFKESRREQSPSLHAYLTYVSLPWHRIIADVLDTKNSPVLSF